MAAMECLCHLIGINSYRLSREENFILEAELFAHLCNELKIILHVQLKDYFKFIKFNKEMENNMIEANFIRCIINDVLQTETYTLSGIAYYTQTPEDILVEIITGQNTNPSLTLSRRIIELHKSVRPELYRTILQKITREHLAVA